MCKFEYYQDKKGEWRFRFFAANGREILCSSEGYKNKQDCKDAWGIVVDTLGKLFQGEDPANVLEIVEKGRR